MAGKPHQQKPDADNLLKALMDAIYNEDCSVWDVRVTKRWGDTGEITIGEIA
ncbi:Endodeoxyribonuclease RusA [compost metagenome]